MAIRPGDAYLFDPDGTNQNHLWVILAVGEEFAVAVHITSLSSRTQRDHQVCIIRPDDQDTYRAFIRVPSYVLYTHVREFEIDMLASMAKHGSVPPELLARICRGLHASRLTRKRFKLLVSRR